MYIHFIIDKGSYNDQINLQGESRIILVIEKMYLIRSKVFGQNLEVNPAPINIMKRQFKELWPTIPPISTTLTITSHYNSLNIKHTTTM